jgi:cellulose synthase/poly-beta-1,6-N-acetylglucosamine synthase-like glycosyltransferase
MKAHFIFYNGLRNFFTLFLFLFFSFTFSFYFFESYFISIIISLICSVSICLILNKKWFNTIKLYQNKLSVEYTFAFNEKKKKEHWDYEEVEKVIYYRYMHMTPAHCKIICSDRTIFRFDCTQKEAEEILSFLKNKNVATEYHNKPKDVYRS